MQAGVEIIVEQNHSPVAVIKTPEGPDRKISECIALVGLALDSGVSIAGLNVLKR